MFNMLLHTKSIVCATIDSQSLEYLLGPACQMYYLMMSSKLASGCRDWLNKTRPAENVQNQAVDLNIKK